MSSYQQRYDNAMRLINAAGLAANSEAFKAAKRLSEELAELAQTAEAGDGATMLAIGPKLVELESLAMQYGVAPASASTGGTPVPASAAPTPPTTPTAPPSGTSKWAPSQATPPAAPAPAPDLTQVKQEITSAVKQGINDLLKPMAEVLPSDANGFVPVASKAEVNDHETRITQLEKAGFDWLVAAFVATGTAIVAYIVMTQGQYSDIVKTVASLAIGAFVGWIVGAFWAGIKSRRQERSSRNAA